MTSQGVLWGLWDILIGPVTYRPIMEMAQSNLIGTLRRLPLFTDLTESELILIAGRVTMRHLRPREIVFFRGRPLQRAADCTRWQSKSPEDCREWKAATSQR